MNVRKRNAQHQSIAVMRSEKAIGNAFCIADDLYITCAHVLDQLFERKDNSLRKIPPSEEICLSVPPFENNGVWKARVVRERWFPNFEDQSGLFDIAIMERTTGSATAAPRNPICWSDRLDSMVSLRPFIPSLGRSVVVKSSTQQRTEFNEIHIVQRRLGDQWIEPGVSGAPAYFGSLKGCVAGMIAWRDKQKEQAFIKPATILREAIRLCSARPYPTTDFDPKNDLVFEEYGCSFRYESKLRKVSIAGSLDRVTPQKFSELLDIILEAYSSDESYFEIVFDVDEIRSNNLTILRRLLYDFVSIGAQSVVIRWKVLDKSVGAHRAGRFLRALLDHLANVNDGTGVALIIED